MSISSLLRKHPQTSWDSSLFTVSGFWFPRAEHHNSSPPSSPAALQRLRHWGAGNPGRGVMQLPLNYSQAKALEASGLVTWSIVVKSIGREISGDIWGRFTDQLFPCLTNAMPLHHLTFQVSKNRSKEQSGATFTSRPQIYTQFFVLPLFLSVCNVFVSQD